MSNHPKPQRHVFVCRRFREAETGKPSCEANGAATVYEAFYQELEARNLLETIQLTATHCLGHCDNGPIAVVYPDGVWYGHLNPQDVPKIVAEHLLGGKPLQKKALM